MAGFSEKVWNAFLLLLELELRMHCEVSFVLWSETQTYRYVVHTALCLDGYDYFGMCLSSCISFIELCNVLVSISRYAGPGALEQKTQWIESFFIRMLFLILTFSTRSDMYLSDVTTHWPQNLSSETTLLNMRYQNIDKWNFVMCCAIHIKDFFYFIYIITGYKYNVTSALSLHAGKNEFIMTIIETTSLEIIGRWSKGREG